MDQARREVKEAVKALALAQASPRRTLGDAERTIPDNTSVTFDVTVRVFGTIEKRHGELSIDAVPRFANESVEEPQPLPNGGLRLARREGENDDCEA